MQVPCAKALKERPPCTLVPRKTLWHTRKGASAWWPRLGTAFRILPASEVTLPQWPQSLPMWPRHRGQAITQDRVNQAQIRAQRNTNPFLMSQLPNPNTTVTGREASRTYPWLNEHRTHRVLSATLPPLTIFASQVSALDNTIKDYTFTLARHADRHLQILNSLAKKLKFTFSLILISVLSAT